MIVVNPATRQFNIPGADLVFGVTDDASSEVKHFQCPRYVGNNVDVAGSFVRINYRNGNGEIDSYLAQDISVDGSNVLFDWVLSKHVTMYKGQISFVMCVVGPDTKVKWHTTLGKGQVLEGLEPDSAVAEEGTADVVAQIIAMVEAQTAAVEKVGVEQISKVKAAAETAQAAAVAEIEAKRVNTLASIPSDYTAMQNAVDSVVRSKAPGIECSAEGEVITLNDASNQALRGLRIFGRSTQDGIPTPENPVEIKSVVEPVVTLYGKNLAYSQGSKDVEYEGLHIVITKGLSEVFLHGTTARSFGYSMMEGTYLVPGVYTMSIHGLNSVSPKYDQAYLLDMETRDTICSEVKSDTPVTFTVTQAGNYRVDFLFAKGSTYDNAIVRVQIEARSEVTKYDPYKAPHTIELTHALSGIPVTAGGNYTDANGQQWICDEVDFERGVCVQRVSKKIYGSGERWQFVKESNGFYRYYLKASDVIATGVPIMSRVASSVLPPIGVTEWDAVTRACIGLHPTDKTINVFVPFATTEEWEAYLSANKMTVIYQLATQIETPLSETELAAYRALHTNKPNTTILNDSGAHMKVDYTADTKLYIDNKIAALMGS